ncbi:MULTISPECIES: helix-turn-helix domain-containing protein [unclassified Nocardioides]|uniref:helix-turn-helix domain-containing protein n=1 Tax=unclassified Nocardioides TaxID=2615069 RepID=UPI0009F13233|nr:MULTISPECIES: helix-turn-helix domain-containing protein [unclassified Nocardioides]GAW48043.1 Gp37 [Nocardioides sp. PD653-B2]GAW53654.1 Gp37 [Nocardioides sp. PD653]
MTTANRTGLTHPDESPWMTLQQAAVYIATSVKTVRRLIAAGDLPAFVCGKRGLRVRRADLDELMRPV